MNIYCERIFLAFVVINGNSFVNIHVIISEMRESNCGVKYVLFALAHTVTRACHFYNYSASGRGARNLALDSLTLYIYGACCAVGNNGGVRYFLLRPPAPGPPLEIAYFCGCQKLIWH
jgi:hypothetical protein